MPKNEEGEFELILGNKQLLSVFFIVVVLLGVFFTMGYIVGRNSPLANAEAPIAEKKESKPMVVNSPAPRESTSAPKETPQETPAEAKESAPPPVPTQTAPQRPAETKPQEPVQSTQSVKSEPPATKSEPARRPEPVKAAPQVDRPSGTYLQLAATSQHEADAEVDLLRGRGFRAMAAEIPEKPGTFRVLVGPVPEAGINKLKTDLEKAGFPANQAIRRTL